MTDVLGEMFGTTAQPQQPSAQPNQVAVRDAAAKWQANGFSAVRVRADGSKAPVGEWKASQVRAADAETVRQWFSSDDFGLGMICGKVSGNLEMFELEGRAMAEGLLDKVKALVPDELWKRFGTYYEYSPSGGLHVLVRVRDLDVPGNVLLARRPSTQAELDDWRIREHRKLDGMSGEAREKRLTFLENLTCEQVPQVLAETRGEGGMVVVAPSGGSVHPSGKPWVIGTGCRPGVVGTISADEREVLATAFRSLDRMPAPREAPRKEPKPRQDGEPLRPGDAYEARVKWSEILEDHGWLISYERSGVTYWTRPGKTFGTSATTGYGDSDLLYVFSSNAYPFEGETTYTKFGAYAVLNHGGDHAAAASQLRREGYGGDRAQEATSPGAERPTEAPDADAEWDEPQPAHAPVLPPFPVDTLPPVLADFTTAVAAATQTPADLPGLTCLLATATAAAGKYRVQVRADWLEPLNLYGQVVLPPGSRKSAVFRSAAEPLYAAERELLERDLLPVRLAEQRRRVLEKSLQKAETKASEQPGDQNLMADAEVAATALAQHVVPPVPRLLVDDTTPEALVNLLAEHTVLGLLSEEGGIFETLAGRYSNGVANLDAVLKAWDGGELRVDRKGSDPKRVSGAALTIGLTVQPAVLARLADHPELSGRGLTQRFLYAMPDIGSTIGLRDVDPPLVPDAVRTHYEDRVRALALLDRPAVPATLTLSTEAAAALRAFRVAIEPRRNLDTGDLADVVEWSLKLEGQLVRVAGLMHLARHGTSAPSVIALDDMANAVRLADYLIAHAKAAHDLMAGRVNDAPAASLRRVILAKRLAEFSVRELHRHVMGQVAFRKKEGVEAALRTLEVEGYVRPLPPEPRSGPGAKPSPRYAANPLWLAKET